MDIQIKGLKVTACHGVLQSEKESPQLFEFDVLIEQDNYKAAVTDDVSHTADYARACAIVSDFCKSNSFNLIEKLAHGAAFLLAESFKEVSAVEVTVHKPQAPVGLPFDDVSVRARVERNKVILSLGSSMGDRAAALGGGIEAISKLKGVKVLKVSDYMQSEPYGGVAKNKFLNCALSIECLLPPRELLKEIHKIEDGAARVRGLRWDDRTLDIDIIFFGNKIICEEGLCIPHPDYKNRPFVILPVKQIAPGFVCPLTHVRMADIVC